MAKDRSWIKRHIKDPFVQEAQKLGYASRAAFKLLEIQKKNKIIKPGMTVVDLGAAPGGWSKVLVECVGRKGRVIAVDLLPMDHVTGVQFIQGDFNDQAVLDQLTNTLGGFADVIISDMAPNLSGQKTIDLPRSVHLLELALDCANQCLKPGGTLLLKAFQGAGLEDFLRSVKTCFSQVNYRKPEASRPKSKELYILAIDFRPGILDRNSQR